VVGAMNRRAAGVVLDIEVRGVVGR
jgi:hypothetical protein